MEGMSFTPPPGKPWRIGVLLGWGAAVAAAELMIWSNYYYDQPEASLGLLILFMAIPVAVLATAYYLWKSPYPAIRLDDSYLEYGQLKFKRDSCANAFPFEERGDIGLRDQGVAFFHDAGGQGRDFAQQKISLLGFPEKDRPHIQKILCGWVPARKIAAIGKAAEGVACAKNKGGAEAEWEFQFSIWKWILKKAQMPVFIGLFIGFVAVFGVYADRADPESVMLGAVLVLGGILLAGIPFLVAVLKSRWVLCIWNDMIFLNHKKKNRLKFEVLVEEVKKVEDYERKGAHTSSRTLCFTMQDGRVLSLDITGYEKPELLVQAIREAVG